MEKEVIIEQEKRASIFLVLFFITTFKRSRLYAAIFSEKSDKQK
jgi:hypothetical protein